MKLTDINTVDKRSKHYDKRANNGKMQYFLTDLAIAMMKHDEAIRNSHVKRGTYKRSNHTDIVKCGCGDETCHFEVDLTKYYKEKK